MGSGSLLGMPVRASDYGLGSAPEPVDSAELLQAHSVLGNGWTSSGSRKERQELGAVAVLPWAKRG